VKKTISTLFLLILGLPALACSCFDPPAFLDYVHSDDFKNINGLVWIGEYVEGEQVTDQLYATKYNVREVICGSLRTEYEITPSPFPMSTEHLDNFPLTNSEIWVFGGAEASCLETHGTNNYLFATRWDTHGPAFGYNTTLCAVDFLPLSGDGSIEDCHSLSSLRRRIVGR